MLDSLYVSPKILHFLRQVRTHFISANGQSQVDLRYLIVPDSRPQAALRPLLMPGAGQRYKNQHTKGWLLTTAAGLGLATTLALHFRRKSAQENYLSAKSITKAKTTYKRYNSLNRARNLSATFTGLVWAYAFFDALITLPTEPKPVLRNVDVSGEIRRVPSLVWQIDF